MMEDEMVGWHHWLNGHEFEQAPGIGDGQGSLVCCSRKELDTTEATKDIISRYVDPLLKSISSFMIPERKLSTGFLGWGGTFVSFIFISFLSIVIYEIYKHPCLF